MPSGQQRARENLAAFEAWVARRRQADDWKDYVRGSALSRSEIAIECGFARSVFVQNPAVRDALAALESRLRVEGALPPRAAEQGGEEQGASPSPPDPRDRRIQELETRIGALRAENADLRDKVRSLEAVCGELALTGRRLSPGRLGPGE